ncbi:MAG: EamA family transporter, partial [Saprospiraceae bacterium]
GFALFLYGQKILPAIESSLISMLEPILTPIWVFVGYGENPGFWALIGGIVIISALIFRIYWIEIVLRKQSLS